MRTKEVEVSIQKFWKILWATIALICFIISAWILVDCFKKEPVSTVNVLSYNDNPTVDYKVYLKPNKFYEDQFMGKNKKYVSSIIDYVDLNFNYNYNTSVLADTSYSYSINAVISSEYEQNDSKAELWSKTYKLVPSTSFTKNGSSGFQINEKLKLDYATYDSLAKKFKDEYSISADAKLSVILTIKSNTRVKDYDKPVSTTKTIKVSMPLNKVVTEITVDGVDPISESITKQVEVTHEVNTVLVVMAIVVAVLSLPIAIYMLYKLFGITNVSQYIVEQKKILKSYQDIIAEVTTRPDLRGLKIIEVKKFEDLINVEEELRVPILFYELEVGNESWFIIATDTQAYRFVLKAISFEKDTVVAEVENVNSDIKEEDKKSNKNKDKNNDNNQ